MKIRTATQTQCVIFCRYGSEPGLGSSATRNVLLSCLYGSEHGAAKFIAPGILLSYLYGSELPYCL